MASGANRIPLGKSIFDIIKHEDSPTFASSLLKPTYLGGSENGAGGTWTSPTPAAVPAVQHGPVRPPTSRFSSAPPPPEIKKEEEDYSSSSRKRSAEYVREESREKDRGYGKDRDRDRDDRDRDYDRKSRDKDRDRERDKYYEKDDRRDRDRGRDRHFWREKTRDSVSSRDYKDDYDSSRTRSRYRDDDEEDYRSHKSSTSNATSNTPAKAASREGSQEGGKKKKKSRWAETTESRAFIPGMPTIIPANLSKEQEKAYLLQLQIEDISRKLRTGDMGISTNPEERSPSPEPIYNHKGKRLNTRDLRTRRRLEDERHKFIQEMFELNADYKPPIDYKAPLAKYTDKVLIPQDEHPEINFVGLLIGPRGNTLKSLEKETGTKIIIRGKGSVKEGKIGRPNRDPLPGEDEPLHAYITGQTPETVKGAVERIKRILVEGIEVPEHQNDLRKQQLRELALLNGTLRDDLGPRCSNCGSTAHRTWNCPDKPNITHSVICTRCGGAGHIAKDCKTDVSQIENNGANMDDEYLSLMAELGGNAPPKKQAPPPPAPAAPSSAPEPSSSASYSGHSGSSYSAGAPPPPPSNQSYSQNNNYAPPPPPATVVHTWTPPGQQQAPSQNNMSYYSSYGMSAWGMGPPGIVPPGLMSHQNGMAAPPPPPPPGPPQAPQQPYGGMYGQGWGMPPPPPPPMRSV